MPAARIVNTGQQNDWFNTFEDVSEARTSRLAST